LVVVVLLVFIFHELAGVLKPLFIAVFLGYLIMPAHRFLLRLRIPSLPSYGVIVLALVVISFVLYRVAYRSAIDVQQRLPVYGEKLEALQRAFHAKLDRLQSMAESLRQGGGDGDPGPAPATAAPPPAADDLSARTRTFLTTSIGTLIGSLVDFLVVFFAILVYLLFLIAEAEGFQRRVTTVFGAERAAKVLRVVHDINQAISGYIAVKTFVSFLVALLSTIVLGLIQVDFFLLWGILTFLFNFIPYVGSVAAAGLPIGLTLLQFGLGFEFVAVALLLAGVQGVMGYGVEPKLTGKRLDLSPLMILLALAFWAWLWGFVGAVLAVPLLVSVKIILEHIEATRPIAGLMSSLPASPGGEGTGSADAGAANGKEPPCLV
ncbi:MAG: AI-2E family transporter, partial [Planctomycetes bacterium]|nr:AI-2E family transporter [Planctomycetota bacterium]